MDDDREKKPSLTSKHTRAPFLLSSPPPLLWFPFSFKNGKFFFFLFLSFEGARRDDDDHKPSSPPPNTTKHTTAKKKKAAGLSLVFFQFFDPFASQFQQVANRIRFFLRGAEWG